MFGVERMRTDRVAMVAQSVNAARCSASACSWRRRLPAVVPMAPRLIVCGADFALAAKHALSLLDREVQKLQAPQKEARQADVYGLLEIALYAVRNLQRCLYLAHERDHPALRLVAHVETCAMKNDLPSAVAPLLADSPTGKHMREELGRMSCIRRRWELPLPPRLGSAAAPAPPVPAIGRRDMMRACLPNSAIPVLGFGTGIFYTTPEATRDAITHAAKELGYVHFDCAQGCRLPC